MRNAGHMFELVVADGFVPIEVGAVLDVIRIANRLHMGAKIDLRITTLGEAGPVVSADGALSVQAFAPGSADPVPTVLIIAGGGGVAERAPLVMRRISRALTKRIEVVLLSDAASAWVRATRGQRRATTHWEDRVTLLESCAADEIGSILYLDDGQPITSAGMAATSDTMLHILSKRVSDVLAVEVARSLVLERIRPGDTPQQARLSDLPGYRNATLRRALDHMERHLSDEIGAADLEQATRVSVRQIERLFRRHLGRPPLQFLKLLRLRRARHLLETTNMPLVDVAVASGLGAPSSFAKSFRKYLGVSPNHYRLTLTARQPPVERAVRRSGSARSS